MDYDFSRLSTRSFEQLVQALAAAAIGPGVVVFGDGPDGGREATFEGRVSFPDPADPWQGYGVVQAKFRQRGQTNDGDWALAELKKELAKFTNTTRQLRKPDYYLFTTNVVLTPVAKKGGKDKLTAYLDSQLSKLGLKDFRIWDYDQLCVLLDNHENVRTAYTAWITPGDVLAAVLKQMQPSQPDFGAVMLNYVQKELQADQYVNLGQAGHNAQDRIPLAKVFVDLPVGEPGEETRRLFEDEDEQQPIAGAMQALRILAAQRLDPDSVKNMLSVGESFSQVPGRVVFIGGPGQGKSTLSQFLCQMHRVAILDAQCTTPQLPEVQDACKLIRQQCVHEVLELPDMPRFPVRVELNRFATALAGGHANSLFDYLLQRIKQRAERDLSLDDLRAWLAAYPWMLVLDGLDEVPASSNRSEVLAAIQNFLVDAHGCNADLLLVATTRPQGYNDDFSSRYYRHRYLLPLGVPQALLYASRLIDQRWGGDADHVQTLMERMQRAGTEDATARLMRSPLQVTIMALLVESVGQPPKERWRLFNDYYQVIFRREKERNILAAELLNTYQADIDAIHQQVGLRLQTDSEQSGGTEALLPQVQFAQLVEQRLTKEGHAGKEGERLKQEIIDAALERLVFLVAPQEDKVGFEIRSLQEFMAAECLMNGLDEDVRRRLRAIAPAAHWRNVFLFAAGRCFHDKQHLRDSLHALCCELNEGDGVVGGGELEQAVLSGSRLALDILEDGAVANQPAQMKLYVRLALRLLELPPCIDQLRLAKLYQPDMAEIFQTEIEQWLAHEEPERRLGAWRVLLQLVTQGVNWAQFLGDRCWPEDAEAAMLIVNASTEVDEGDWLAMRWLDAIPRVSPAMANFGLFQYDRFDKFHRLMGNAPKWLKALCEWQPKELETRIEGVDRCFHLRVRSVFESKEMAILQEEPSGEVRWEWRWLVAAHNFSCNPSKERLAELLSRIISEEVNDIVPLMGFFGNQLPWPIQACIAAAKHGADLLQLKDAALSGMLADHQDWQLAEQRWQEQGLVREDSYYKPEAGLPFDKQIAYMGFPFNGSGATFGYSSSRGSIIVHVIEPLHGLLQSSHVSPAAKRTLADNLRFVLGIAGREGHIYTDLSIAELRYLVSEAQRNWMNIALLRSLPDHFWQEPEGIEVLALLGECGTLTSREEIDDVGNRLESLVLQYSTLGGLWRLLAAACIAGYRPNLPGLLPDPLAFTDPRYQVAALQVQVAQACWNVMKASALAEQLAALGKTIDKAIADTLSIIEKLEITGRAMELFLVALFNALPHSAWEDRRNVVKAMQEQQRRRLSDAASL
ncbi:MAG: NACHT domain-containing protein [Methylobacter sp.]